MRSPSAHVVHRRAASARIADPRFFAYACCVFVLASLGCALGPSARVPMAASAKRVAISDGWLAMGTFFEVDLRVETRDRAAARTWLRSARAELVRLEQIYSRYDPKSELSRLNRRLSRGEPRTASPPDSAERLSPELFAILRASEQLARASGGAFDVSVGPVIRLWKAAEQSGEAPTPAALARARERIGLREEQFRVDREIAHGSRTLEIDLDALSKGAALDLLASDFRRRFPGAAALMSFGQSSVAAVGDPDGRGWRLAIASRDVTRGTLGLVALRDQALSVSSSLGSQRRIGGRSYSHVIDPRDGLPVDGSVEVVVVRPLDPPDAAAPGAAQSADAWSTALVVLGASGVPALREELRALPDPVRPEPDAGGFLVFDREGRLYASPGARAFFSD